MPQALIQPELFALLHAGETIVVPHAHAARTLRARCAAAAPDPAPTQDPGTILAWSEWTRSFWPDLTLDGREERALLNRAQEEQLWADIIGSHSSAPANTALLHQVKLARSGLQLACGYNAVDGLRRAADSFDTRTFASWVDAFRDLCSRQRLLPAAFLDATLAAHLRAGALPPPQAVHMVGFDEFRPAQRDLLAAFRRAGTQINQHFLLPSTASAGPGFALTVPAISEQLQFAVRWIAEQSRQTPGTFALITPRAEEHRPALERYLRQYLAPELDAVGTDLSSTPWYFVSSPALGSATVVAHAFALLRWMQKPLSLEGIGQLLLSPYLAFAETKESRARFEANTLRTTRLLRPELDLFDFLTLLKKAPRKAHMARFPELHTLAGLADRKALSGPSRLHADWADLVRSLLAAVGWPGPRALTPLESNAVDAWDGLLDLLCTLDRNGRRISFAHFLQQLEAELASSTSTSPSIGAPVQILSLAEAEAIPFDHVLVLDATDRELPAPEHTHALLPRRLQTSLAMPGGDAATTYRRTHEQLQHLATRVGSLHLLAPAQDGAGPLHFTRLARDLGFTPASPESLLPAQPDPVPVALMDIPDPGQLPGLPSTAIRGGARVLELQAACGFRAFADLRLRAEEPQSSSMGLNPREAGSRLHEALHKLWQELGSQANLRSLPHASRRAAVETAVDDALRPLTSYPGADHPWTQAFLSVVRQRYTDLLLGWLRLELDRAPFQIVAGEQEETIRVGPLDLKVRPDRIDKVNDGLVYIDYKTKFSLSPDDWLGSRPAAPQLPLYTLLAKPGEVRGLAFGRLRPGKQLSWVSLFDTPGLFPDKKGGTHNLEAEAENWREELARLAQAFADGDTTVDPKSYPTTCEFCAFRLLCRLNPEELLTQTASSEDDSEEDHDL